MEQEGMPTEAGDVSVEDLHKAADEARTELESQTSEGDTELEAEREPSGKDTDAPDEPADNAARTKLGMKVAKQEQVIEQLSNDLRTATSQLSQVTSIINWFAEEAQKQQHAQQSQQEEQDEYIPTDKKGFLNFLEQYQNQQMSSAQRDQQQFATRYLSTLDGLERDEEDPALVAEIRKLTSEPGQPFNKRYSNDAAADAERNWFKAKDHIRKQQTQGRNPLKGGKPSNPLGSAPSSASRSGDKPIVLDAFAKRAAKAWGYDEKKLKEMGL